MSKKREKEKKKQTRGLKEVSASFPSPLFAF